MTKPELAIVIILRVIGITALFAIPAIFRPIRGASSPATIDPYLGTTKLK